MTQDGTISLAWLLQFVFMLLVAAIAYFLKRAADALDRVEKRVAEHDTAIALLEREQLSQSSRLETAEKDIDRSFLRHITQKDGESE